MPGSASEDPGLVGHDADRESPDVAQARHDLPGPAGPQFEELAVVDHVADDVTHVVGRGLAFGDEFPQLRGGTQHGVGDGPRRGDLVGVRGKVLQQRSQGSLHIVGLHRAHAARSGMRGHPTQLVQPDLDPGELRHHLRS